MAIGIDDRAFSGPGAGRNSNDRHTSRRCRHSRTSRLRRTHPTSRRSGGAARYRANRAWRIRDRPHRARGIHGGNDAEPHDDRRARQRPTGAEASRCYIRTRPHDPRSDRRCQHGNQVDYDDPGITAASAPAMYTVAGGDTVSDIAGRFGLSTASVLALNGLGWSSLIFPGNSSSSPPADPFRGCRRRRGPGDRPIHHRRGRHDQRHRRPFRCLDTLDPHGQRSGLVEHHLPRPDHRHSRCDRARRIRPDRGCLGTRSRRARAALPSAARSSPDRRD